jgi:hypothetical protein
MRFSNFRGGVVNMVPGFHDAARLPFAGDLAAVAGICHARMKSPCRTGLFVATTPAGKAGRT